MMPRRVLLGTRRIGAAVLLALLLSAAAPSIALADYTITQAFPFDTVKSQAVSATSTVFETARGALTGAVAVPSYSIGAAGSAKSGSVYTVKRFIVTFDLSALPAGATITSESIGGTYASTGVTTVTVNASGLPADHVVAPGDFLQLPFVELFRDTFTGGVWTVYPLPWSAVTKATPWVVISNPGDSDDVAPTGISQASVNNLTLYVTYTLPSLAGVSADTGAFVALVAVGGIMCVVFLGLGKR